MSPTKELLATELEFVCFDDRYLIVTSRIPGQGGLFDALTGTRSRSEDHPQLYQPGGLYYGGQGCNGYYTSLLGPGLLMEGNRAPFLPSCDSFNRANTRLKNHDWFDRPCADG